MAVKEKKAAGAPAEKRKVTAEEAMSQLLTAEGERFINPAGAQFFVRWT